MRTTNNKFLLLLFLSLAFLSCDDKALYKSYEEIPNAEWKMEDIKTFEFEIKDNTKPTLLHYLVRNAVQYPFYNLYLKATLKDSTGKILQTGMDQMILFDEKTGKPLGDGMGDLFDQRVVAPRYQNYKFPYNGKYSMELQHNMRPDPLLGLMGIGLEIVDLTKQE